MFQLLVNPTKAWTQGTDSFNKEIKSLATKFAENFKTYADQATAEVKAAGPEA